MITRAALRHLVLASSALVLAASCGGNSGNSEVAGPDASARTDGDARADGAVAVDAVTPDAGGTEAGRGPIVLSDMRAFPTAEGYGAVASGGRGGEILYVTTTEDTGAPGSLRWALRQEQPRIVYFLVGGAFVLNSLLQVSNGNLTVAGETAHDLGGVHLYASEQGQDRQLVFSNVENVVLRFLSSRGGWQELEATGARHSPMTMVFAHRVMIDHYSGGWAGYAGGNISKIHPNGRGGLATTQWSLLHESSATQNVGGVGGIQMDYVRDNFPADKQAAAWAAWDGFSNHHNAFIGLTHRFFNTSGNGTIADRVINNVVYGWRSRMSRHTGGNQPIDIYRNVYLAAPYNHAVDYKLMHKFDFNDFYNLAPPIEYRPSFFLAENLIVKADGTLFQDVGADNWPMLTHFADTAYGREGAPVTAAGRRTELSAAEPVPVTVDPVADVEALVLARCGSGVRYDADGTPRNVDPIEQRYLQWVRERGGPTFSSTTRGDHGLGDSASFVRPEYESHTRDRASLDSEGVPLGWQPPADVRNDAGYSRLEMYLADIAGDFHALRARQ